MIRNKLNSICPYFAMFPLDYPMDAIEQSNAKSVLDPFCGRGTTNVAARLNGIQSVGIDSSRVAYAISSAKMVNASPEDIVKECANILESDYDPEIPEGEFWKMMYDQKVLEDISNIRQALLEDCSSPERIALRGILLGALHGPKMVDGSSSYLSNQFPRTFASKPAYSVKYWKNRGFTIPPKVNVINIINRRAHRYYSENLGPINGFIIKGDSTNKRTYYSIVQKLNNEKPFDTIITSPPYHGMNTYIPDQWIRNWFVGGPASVEYSIQEQASGNLSSFIDQLSQVWINCSEICRDGAKMFVRFGEVSQNNENPEETIIESFEKTNWHVQKITSAGQPPKSHRSSSTFIKNGLREYKEIDIIADLC